jgi:hypothetical protein
MEDKADDQEHNVSTFTGYTPFCPMPIYTILNWSKLTRSRTGSYIHISQAIGHKYRYTIRHVVFLDEQSCSLSFFFSPFLTYLIYSVHFSSLAVTITCWNTGDAQSLEMLGIMQLSKILAEAIFWCSGAGLSKDQEQAYHKASMKGNIRLSDFYSRLESCTI